MEQLSYVFTILFMLLGPIKLIPSFSRVTRGADSAFKRSVALRGAIIAAALCVLIAFVGGTLLGRYRISLNALRIAGGLVLLIAALRATFKPGDSSRPGSAASTAIQVAASPVAVPNIVPPAGVAAILIFMMHAPHYPGLVYAVMICLAVVLFMDFLVMYFIDAVLKTPGLTVILTVLGSALVFIQICLAIEMMLVAFRELSAAPL